MEKIKKESNSTTGISRREFMKGVAAVTAAGAGAAALASCAPARSGANEGKSAVITSEGVSFPWETPPTSIPSSKIKRTVDADVVVVGSGLSGLSAALSSAEQGAKVVVIEKGATWTGRGGGVGVFDSKFLRKLGIKNDKYALARQWMSMCGNRANESLVWLFINESGNAMDWLLDKAEAAKLPVVLWDGYYRGETYKELPGYHMFVGGPMSKKGLNPAADVSYLLYNEAKAKGVTFIFGTPGEQLIKENNRVVGIVAKNKEGYLRVNARKGVILATGDIGGNPEMCAAYAPLALKANESQYTPVGVNTGDGHKMGMWVGGALEETPFPTMIHPQAFSWLNYSSLFVNQRGERYMNEDTWVQAKTIQAMKQPGEGPWCYSIIDSNWPETVAKTIPYGGGMFWDSFRVYGKEWTPDGDKKTIARYLEGGKNAWQADTLEDLAAKIKVPAAEFVATVKRYNALAQKKEDSDFGKRPELLYPIEKGPFIALKFGGALLAVTGGLNVDLKLRVLDKAQNPITGLYAVGNVSGGLYGVDYPIPVPGNSHGKALTWGYLVGKNIMEEKA